MNDTNMVDWVIKGSREAFEGSVIELLLDCYFL